MTSHHLFARLCISSLHTVGRTLSSFSLPAFFSRVLGNGAELRREAETWKRLYEAERAERLKLQDRLLVRQGTTPLETVVANPVRPSVKLPELSPTARDITFSDEEEAMMAASDPERLALLQDAAADSPEWERVYRRAKEIIQESTATQYGGMQ